MARHRRTHEAENPFPCSFRPCQAKFPTRKLLNDHEKYSHGAAKIKKRFDSAQEPQTYSEIKKVTPENTPCHSPRNSITPKLSGNTLAPPSIDHYSAYSRLADASSLLSSTQFGSNSSFIDQTSDHFQHSRNQTMSTTYQKSPEMSYEAISSALLSFQNGTNKGLIQDDMATHFASQLQNFPTFDPSAMLQNQVQRNFSDPFINHNNHTKNDHQWDSAINYFTNQTALPRDNLSTLQSNFDSQLSMDFRTTNINELHGLPYPRPKSRGPTPPRINTQLHHLYQTSTNLGEYNFTDDRGHFSAPATTNGQFPDALYSARYPFSSYPNTMSMPLLEQPNDKSGSKQ